MNASSSCSADASSATTTEKAPRENRDRQLLLFSVALSTCFFVGAALGFGPMQLMLEENGSFYTKCDGEETNSIPLGSSSQDGTRTACASQTAILVKVGLLIPSAQIVSPLLGLFVDKFGPKISAVAQAACLLTGLAVVLGSVSSPSSMTDPLLFLGFGLIALHTWLGRLLIVQLGLYFVGHDISRVIFVLNSLFDAGATTYLGLWGIKQATGASTTSMIAGYTIMAALISAGSVYCWIVAVPKDRNVAVEELESELDRSKHKQNFPSVDEPKDLTEILCGEDTSSMDITNNCSETEEMAEPEGDIAATEKTKKDDDAYTLIAERTRGEQLTSPPFVLLCVIFGLNVMSNNWNIMTQRAFLAGLGDDDHDNLYLTLFVLMTPVSVLGAPLMDRIILRFGWMAGFQTINLLGLGYTLIKVASTNLNVQILGFIMFSFYRSFLFGISFSFLPTLVAGKLVGTAAGTIAGVAGCATLFTIPLVNLAVKQNEGDFFVSNMIMMALVIPTVVLVCVLRNHMIQEQRAKEAQTTRTNTTTTKIALPETDAAEAQRCDSVSFLITDEVEV